MSVRPCSQASWHNNSEHPSVPADTGSERHETALTQQQLYIELWAERQRLSQERAQILNRWESAIYQHQTYHNTMARQLAESVGDDMTRSVIDNLRHTHGRLLADYRTHLTHLENMRQLQQNLHSMELEVEARERQLLVFTGQDVYVDGWQVASSDEPSESGDLYSLTRSVISNPSVRSPVHVKAVELYYSDIAKVRMEIERIDDLVDDRDKWLEELRANQDQVLKAGDSPKDQWTTFKQWWDVEMRAAKTRLESVVTDAESTLKRCGQDGLIPRINQELINGQFVMLNDRLQDLLEDQINTRLLCLRLRRIYRLEGLDVQKWLDADYEPGTESEMRSNVAADRPQNPDHMLYIDSGDPATAFDQQPVLFGPRQRPILWLSRGRFDALRQNIVASTRSEPSLRTLFGAVPP